jgi:hypothetical protein
MILRIILFAFICSICKAQNTQNTVLRYVPQENGYAVSVPFEWKFFYYEGELLMGYRRIESGITSDFYMFEGKKYTSADLGNQAFTNIVCEALYVSGAFFDSNIFMGQITLSGVIDHNIGAFEQSYHLSKSLGLKGDAYKNKLHQLSFQNIKITKVSTRNYELETKIRESEKKKEITAKNTSANEAYNQGNYEKASALYKEVLQADPGNYQAKQNLESIKAKLAQKESEKKNSSSTNSSSSNYDSSNSGNSNNSYSGTNSGSSNSTKSSSYNESSYSGKSSGQNTTSTPKSTSSYNQANAEKQYYDNAAKKIEQQNKAIEKAGQDALNNYKAQINTYQNNIENQRRKQEAIDKKEEEEAKQRRLLREQQQAEKIAAENEERKLKKERQQRAWEIKLAYSQKSSEASTMIETKLPKGQLSRTGDCGKYTIACLVKEKSKPVWIQDDDYFPITIYEVSFISPFQLECDSDGDLPFENDLKKQILAKNSSYNYMYFLGTYPTEEQAQNVIMESKQSLDHEYITIINTGLTYKMKKSAEDSDSDFWERDKKDSKTNNNEKQSDFWND